MQTQTATDDTMNLRIKTPDGDIEKLEGVRYFEVLEDGAYVEYATDKESEEIEGVLGAGGV